MAGTKNTISDLLSRLVVDVDNMNSFLYSLEKMLESQSENISITQKLDDGTTRTINVPSFGYLKGKIDDVNTKFDTLISANDDVIGIKSSNGDVRKFQLKKVSKLIQELEGIKDANVAIPTSFGVKNNWFFESFLNPLLFIGVDVSSVLTDDIDQFNVKRIIINSTDDDQLAFFDDNYKENNDIDLDNLLSELDNQGIDYFEDDNVISMPTAINRYKGSFDVTKIFEESVPQTLTSTGETVSVTRRRYRLNALTYTDILDENDNTRILSAGDVLITDNDSEYRVSSVDKTNSEVVLERIFGIEPITIGANILRIKPVPYRLPELQVNVGYNERQIVFFRPVSTSNNLTIDDYSKGFGVFTNELTTTLEDNSTSTLEDYYNNFVADFGLILLNSAKEKKLPAIVAETPDAPTLTATDFEVVQIDQHIKEDEDAAAISNQIAEKENIKTQIKENLKEIDSLKSQLNDSQKTQSEKQRIEKKIDSSIKKKSTLQTQLGATVRQITTAISTTPAFVRTPKYRVRGFWPIPGSKSSRYGNQEVVQFKIRYRYLSKKGTAPNAKQSAINENGSTKFATFSPWTEVLTKPRTRELNEETGLYSWVVEDVSNADLININQLDIPIRKGETLEFQVKSLSEAGWPDNPAESDWSDSIQVAFPADVESAEEATIVSQKTFAEQARLDFEDELTARGLDLHLGTQFTTGERFFSHRTKDIASGFFTTEGNIIDLFEQLQSFKTQIESLQQSISEDKGVIKVSIIDPLGNTSEVKRGDTLKLFSGYYRDEIKDTTGGSVVYNEGRIITKQYVLSIENTSASALELVSFLRGGIDQVATASSPTGFPDSDYHVNRRYDLIPMSISTGTEGDIDAYTSVPSRQSSQVQSQFVYARYKNYGLSQDLNSAYPIGGSYSTTAASLTYDGQGQTIGSESTPNYWGHMLPFKPENSSPLYTNGGINSSVWNGTTPATGIPNGGGIISEFCIHKDHPDIQNLGAGYDVSVGSNLLDLVLPKFKEVAAPPAIDSDATQVSLPFAHALFMETSVNEKTGKFGNSHYQQAEYDRPVNVTDNSLRGTNNYPIKLGFDPNDEYLIGKYTCGAYLYLFPNSYQSISVDGNHPSLSVKSVQLGSENAINVPILFQYRASDILGNIGGWRSTGSLNNIKYSKKIGIDVIVKDEAPFSFDVEISAQYKKETTLDSPVVSSVGTVRTSF